MKIISYNLWEARTRKILQGKKRPKFSAISDNFRIWSRIYPERIEISKIGKASDQQQPLHGSVTFGPLKKL